MLWLVMILIEKHCLGFTLLYAIRILSDDRDAGLDPSLMFRTKNLIQRSKAKDKLLHFT